MTETCLEMNNSLNKLEIRIKFIQIDMKITYSEDLFDFIAVYTRLYSIQFNEKLRIQNGLSNN